jgi:diguanylate cyclase (GGDEF)-like protein/PAS domain S-box-containing protein
MSSTNQTIPGFSGPFVHVEVGPSVGQRQNSVGDLLSRLQEAAPGESWDGSAHEDHSFDNKLAVVRLGIASSLFYALRAKHAPTAAHALRVALSCSAWSERSGLDPQTRDRIEIAALLHDVGKIGIPDRILRKPGKLTVDERLTMDLTPQLGVEILRGCTSDIDLLDMIRYAHTWYESRRVDEGPRGQALPLGSRMLSIASAFDAMTTDTVYRPAMSRETALGELLCGAGAQFDPDLTGDFVRMLEDRPELLQGAVVHRWIHSLRNGAETSIWSAPVPGHVSATHSGDPYRTYFEHWIHHTMDGVVFLDSEGFIVRWNDRMASMTGIGFDAMLGKQWDESALRLRSDSANSDEAAGLFHPNMQRGETRTRSMAIEQPGRSATPLEVQVSMVPDSDNHSGGYVIVLHNLSDEAKLKSELDTLRFRSTQDSLTKVANRAHFDKTIAEMSKLASNSKLTYSLVICDIDHFKKVNDIHGHQAGDDALIKFAEVLREHSRDGDLVARYGGEEFLLLARGCDNATATRRAEGIRLAIEKRSLPSLNNECITASFGVTQFQPGDSPETVVARADRALLKAKENGRNRVIQLGSGDHFHNVDSVARSGWRSFWPWAETNSTDEFDIITPVPIDLAIEKLRGFIADHGAEIIRVDENQVSIRVNVTVRSNGRRSGDQQVAIQASLTLSERKPEGSLRFASKKTKVHVILNPIRNRDRRGTPLKACYTQLTTSLRSYLMGEIETESSKQD